MGNEASSAMAVANAKGQFNKTMADVNEQLGVGNKKTEGPANKKERDERRKEHEADYKYKQEARAERKAKLEEQWSAHKQQNSEPAKKGFFGGAASK
jgi:uncharacterized protein YaiL (DUF2058 family)